MDYPTLLKKSKVQGSQDGRGFLAKSYKRDNEEFDDCLLEDSVRNTSSSTHTHDDFEINHKARYAKECKLTDDLLRKLRPSSDSEWIINDETLRLLENDPQQVIQCVQSGDRVLFALTGKNKFKRTMVVSKELKFISKVLGPKKSTSDSAGNASYTCPNYGPFLRINASNFKAIGFIINNCEIPSGPSVVIILPGASALFNNININNNKIRPFRIFSKAKLTLKDSCFEHNYVRGGGGGVIRAKSQG